jgi:hypothetical protein
MAINEYDSANWMDGTVSDLGYGSFGLAIVGLHEQILVLPSLFWLRSARPALAGVGLWAMVLHCLSIVN